MDKKEIKLADMVPKEWFKDQDASSFWLRVYTTLPVPQNKIQEYFKDAICSYTIDSQPINIDALGLDKLELSKIKNCIIHSHPENGGMIVPVEIEKVLFPKSSYIFFIAPYKVDGLDGNENKTKSNLDQLEAILSASLGSNTLHSLIYEGEQPLTYACKFQHHGQVVQVLNQCEGPFLNQSNWTKAKKITSAIEILQDEDKKNRLRLALQYYQKGKNIFRSEEKFFFYWTAITIVTKDAGTMGINNKLQIIYSKDKAFVEDELKWKWAVEYRNDFFKRGIRPNLHANRERYFQLLFLDLLERELGFETEKHLLSYIKNFPNWNTH